MSALKDVFRDPRIYHAFQFHLGFFESRRYSIQHYLPDSPALRILDIGCGPGQITQILPAQVVNYVGFDTDRRYIEFARRNFGDKYEFRCEEFSAKSVGDLQFDVVMMNGLLHHLPDSVADTVLRESAAVLVDDGQLLAIDSCLYRGQGRLDRWLNANDRGKFVRAPQAYDQLVARHFERVDVDVRADLARVPFSFAFTHGLRPKRP